MKKFVSRKYHKIIASWYGQNLGEMYNFIVLKTGYIWNSPERNTIPTPSIQLLLTWRVNNIADPSG